jgi:NADH-quinone oxidoreductase subunit N
MLEQILHSAKLLQPETALTITLCAVIVVDLIFRKHGHMTGWLAFLGLVVTAVFVGQQSFTGSNTIFFNMFAVDSFSIFFKGIILVSAMFVVLFSFHFDELTHGKRSLGEYYALILALTLGLFLMSGATNLLMMYLALELSSISSYILSGYTKEAPDSSEASLKYVIYGAVSSGIMLYGISILYGLTGSIDIYTINRTILLTDVNLVALVIATVFIIVGFGYKISAVPFHFWTPDVYEGAPITITAFLSVASKAAGFAMMIRFLKVAFINPAVGNLVPGMWATFRGFDWNLLIAMLSVLSMTIGNLIALSQKNLKRLLAYSSIAHAGYMLMGVVVMSNEGLSAILIYFVVYLFMNFGAFYSVMIIANKTGSEEIDSYKGLGRRAPILAVVFTIFLLSLTGIPPTAGFIGKLYLFASLINAHWFWLAIVGVLNSVISLYYYVRIVRNMFLRDVSEDLLPIRLSPSQLLLLLLLVAPTIILGLYFTPLVEYAQASVTMFGIQ